MRRLVLLIFRSGVPGAAFGGRAAVPAGVVVDAGDRIGAFHEFIHNGLLSAGAFAGAARLAHLGVAFGGGLALRLGRAHQRSGEWIDLRHPMLPIGQDAGCDGNSGHV